MAKPLALVWDLIAVDNASGVFSKVGTAAGAASAKTSGITGAIQAAAAAISVAAVGASVVSVKMATDFQSAMTQIQTQAGASADEVRTMSKAILDLAGQTATAPEALATSLYHVESIGLRGAKALDVVKIAAEGAKIGNADLEQTTNALTSTVASGIPGVEDMAQAMGKLNAIVGAGDMKMQDLNDALGSGILTVVKGFGLNLTDVGAALATFGDNNIRGADAATMLRMAVQAMAKPAKGGEKALAALGISSTQLAKDMSEGGLNKALTDLSDHLDKSGVKADEVGGVLTTAFGKKAGPGLMVLEGQMDRFHTKLEEVGKSGDNFGQDWQTWQSTMKASWDEMRAKIEAVAIKIGTALFPVAKELVDKFAQLFDWAQKNGKILGELAGVIVAVGGAIMIASAATKLFAALSDPVTLIILGIIALGVAAVYAYNHFKGFHDFVDKAWVKIKEAAKVTVDWFEQKAWPVLVKIWDDVRDAVSAFVDWFKSDAVPFLSALWDQIRKDAQAVADWYQANVAPAFAAFADFMAIAIHRVAQVVTWLWENVIRPVLAVISAYWAGVWHLLAPILSAAWDVIKGVLVGAFDSIKIVFETVLHVITDIFRAGTDILKGHWSDAWHDVTKIFSDVWNGIIKEAENIGSNVVGGLIKGIKSAISGVSNAVSSVASTVSSTFKSVLGIHSPSTVFAGFGMNIGQGLVNGISSMHAPVNKAVASLVQVPDKVGNGTTFGSAGTTRLHPDDLEYLAARIGVSTASGAQTIAASNLAGAARTDDNTRTIQSRKW